MMMMEDFPGSEWERVSAVETSARACAWSESSKADDLHVWGGGAYYDLDNKPLKKKGNAAIPEQVATCEQSTKLHLVLKAT